MKWLVVNAKADDYEMVISGQIGGSIFDDSGTTSKEFRDEFSKIPQGRKITLRINSQGGSVKDGLEIYHMLKSRSSDVTAYVDGFALSIASLIPLAADRVISPKGSLWMLHKPRAETYGTDEDHLQNAEMLKTCGEMMADVYADELGKSKAEMLAVMKKETWFTGLEATAFGLSDETPEEDSKPAFAKIDLSKYHNIPPNIFNMLSGPVRPAEPKQNIMNKDKLIAVLSKRGVTASADWTDEQFEQALNGLGDATARVPDPNLDNAEANKRIQKLEARVEAEKFSRLRAEVTKRGENKIANEDLDYWTQRAMEDETQTFAVIDRMNAINPGAGAARGTIEILNENPLEKIQKEHKTPQARAAAMQLDWSGIYADAVKRDQRKGELPMASNTYSATLVTSFLMDGSVTNLQNRWAMLKAFSIDTSPDPYKPKATGVLKHVTAGTACQVDATNFELGDTTVAPSSVVMHQYTQPFNVSNADLNSGLRMNDLVTLNTALFSNAVIEAATVPMTAAIFGAATVVSSAAAFSFTDMAALQAALKKSPIKNLILDGAYIARISNTPGFFQTAGVVGGDTGAWKAFGWDLIAQNTDWVGAGANVQGFACHPQAIAGIVGLPLAPAMIPGGILSQNTFLVPGLDITVALYQWFNPATRVSWMSYDVMAGFVQVDTTAGFLLTSQ